MERQQGSVGYLPVRGGGEAGEGAGAPVESPPPFGADAGVLGDVRCPGGVLFTGPLLGRYPPFLKIVISNLHGALSPSGLRIPQRMGLGKPF